MRTISFNTFNGGMTDDPRDPREAVARITKHFNNYSIAHRLTPYRSMVADGNETTLATYQITRMLTYNGELYGTGKNTTGAFAQIYYKNGGGPTGTWTAYTTGGSGADTGHTNNPDGVMFLMYQGFMFGSSSTAGVWWSNLTNSFIYNSYSTNKPTGQGLVHSKDDIMYFPSNNLIIKNTSGATPSYSVALTLPTGATIAAICEYGNFLAIAANIPNGSIAVYLWDRDATLAALPDIINWGPGTMSFLENLGGTLVGVSTNASSTSTLNPRVFFKYYNGSQVIPFQEFKCSTLNVISAWQVFDRILYFLGEAVLNGTNLSGVWKIVKDPNNHLSVSFDHLPRNDTDVGPSTGRLKALFRWGDYVFVSYLEPVNLGYSVWRTTSAYTATSIYETTINPEQPERYRASAGMRSEQKQLMAVNLMTEPLTSGQTANLYYRVDSNSGTAGTWTQILTNSTVGNVANERVKDINGTSFTTGREYEFRIESTGGAEITELRYKIEANESLL